MFASAISHRNIHKWHAIDTDKVAPMATFVTAVCGAPVVNPYSPRRPFATHSLGEDIGARFDSRCQSCLRIVREAQKGTS